VDLILVRGGSVEMAIEIKRTTAPTVSRGFPLACDALEPKARFVVHGGTDTWPMPHGVTAIGLSALMTQLLRNG